MNLFDWQIQHATKLAISLGKYRVAGDGSDTGIGKMYIACAIAQANGWEIVALCPKAVVAEWHNVAAKWSVPCRAFGYEALKTGKYKDVGTWVLRRGYRFKWAFDPNRTLLVIDEAHRCGGSESENSEFIIAARNQCIRTLVTSATMMTDPLRAKGLGYLFGLHNINNYSQWLKVHGVKGGLYGLQFVGPDKQGIMAQIRRDMGAKFYRLRKDEVPGFPEHQIVLEYAGTEEMPELENEYSMEARCIVEELKLPAVMTKVESCLDEGKSIVVVVNFRKSIETLKEKFPSAGVIWGGQTPSERATVINSFQKNEIHVVLVIAQAGGTGVSLHDVHAQRERVAIILPGWSADDFLQALGRHHRAGGTRALTYILLASGVPFERRLRLLIETKLSSLSSLNSGDITDAELCNPTGIHTTPNSDAQTPAHD